MISRACVFVLRAALTALTLSLFTEFGLSRVTPLFVLVDVMESYACKSWFGNTGRDDVYVISVGGNGQAWSYDAEVAHLTINVAVCFTWFFHDFVCASRLLCFAQVGGQPMTVYAPRAGQPYHEANAIDESHAQWILESVCAYSLIVSCVASALLRCLICRPSG